MKELGEYLKRTRIKNGVSVDEAAEDNNLSTSQLESIESGNIRAFKDVYKLRDYINGYAKYLGLDPIKVTEEFNDFLFEHTSKISITDVIEAQKIEKEVNNGVKSPYTKEYKLKKDFRPYFYIIGGILLICIVVYIIFKLIVSKKPVYNDVLLKDEVTYYELTY